MLYKNIFYKIISKIYNTLLITYKVTDNIIKLKSLINNLSLIILFNNYAIFLVTKSQFIRDQKFSKYLERILR